MVGGRMPGSRTRPYDAIVVGAGPAGSVAARTLARGGARVLVLERAHFPRNKPCGGGLTLRALRRFPWLEPELSRITTDRIGTLRMEAPSGRHVIVDAGRPTIMLVRRHEFDHLLIDVAREAGAELMEGVEILQAEQDADCVRLKSRDGRVFEAPFIVAADGVHSAIAKRLGVNKAWPAESVALDMMEETSVDRMTCTSPETLWVFFGYGGAHGYGYIFPKRRHVNVGVGSVLEPLKAATGQSPYGQHLRFVEWLRARGLVDGESQRSSFTPFLIPVGGPVPATTCGRVLFAGDAGGFVNGFTAEGIYFAMVTGELAGRSVLGGGAPREYEKLWRRELGAELRDSILLRRFVFASPERVESLVRGLGAVPFVSGLIVRYATGEISYTGARLRFVLRFPRVAAKLAASHFRLSSRSSPRRESARA
jgi:geranylgeranyl reductase family protein